MSGGPGTICWIEFEGPFSLPCLCSENNPVHDKVSDLGRGKGQDSRKAPKLPVSGRGQGVSLQPKGASFTSWGKLNPALSLLWFEKEAASGEVRPGLTV